MTTATKPFFIVSSGRSGTAMLHKALSTAGDVAMHHEYMVHIIQPLAVARYMGWIDSAEALATLKATYGAAIQLSQARLWGDSSNKASWLIPELAELLPTAKFVHLVRDGRKVASSYFHKLGDECYDDRSTQILRSFAEHGGIMPPPEKKYWWPLPRRDDPFARAFENFDQFERISWHWAEINRVILESLAGIPRERQHFVRLEDLQHDSYAIGALLAFLDLPFSGHIAAMFRRPHNVNRPEDKLLTPPQRTQFETIADAMMRALGYAEAPEYVVNY